MALGEQFFGDREKSTKWLNKPLKALEGKTPLGAAAESPEGARMVEELIGRVDHGYIA